MGCARALDLWDENLKRILTAIMFGNLSLFALLTAIISLTGCATVMTKGDAPKVDRLTVSSPEKPSVTFRVFRSIERQDSADKVKYSAIYDNSTRTVLERALTNQDAFSHVKFAPASVFESSAFADVPKDDYEKALTVSSSNVDTDLLIDVYIPLIDKGHRHAYEIILLGPLSVACLATVGIIPAFAPYSRHYSVTIRGPRGKQLAHSEISTKATQWLWTPLLLFSGSRRWSDRTTLIENFEENAMRAAIQGGLEQLQRR